MKILKYIFQTIKWIVIVGIILFSISPLLYNSYAQTAVFWLIAGALAFWPKSIKNKWNQTVFISTRIGFIIILVLIKVVFLKSEPKTTIYTSEENKKTLYEIYDTNATFWPENTEDIFLETKYGKVHVLACGKKENPPILLFHAASMGAHSWAENLEPLLPYYRVFAVDNIGEANKSQLKDALIYPNSSKEIADFYEGIANELGIEKSPVLGSSNGGFIAQVYAFYYPEKVEKLALFGPMGLTQLTGKSIFMLGFASMYPIQSVRNNVTKWAIGEDDYVTKKYGAWFNQIMKASIPSVSQPAPMTTGQKQKMKLPVLLFLGTKDAIVGDAETAKKTAMVYPNIQIEILESGHLISVEKAEYVNKKLIKFLNL